MYNKGTSSRERVLAEPWACCLYSAAEGCMEMDSSLDGLLLTAEGTVVVDNPKALTASNAGLVSALIDTAFW